jgi:hypothetical protein
MVRTNLWILGKSKRRALSARHRERGRRRTRQDQISLKAWEPVKLRTFKIRTERRKPVSSAGPDFEKRELPETTIQPFDLMSRRHPLSSPEPSDLKPASKKQIV